MKSTKFPIPPVANRGVERTDGEDKIQNSDLDQVIPKENRIIFDWVSFTTKMHSVSDLIDFLGLRGVPFETVSGSKGYQWREYFGGISIHFNPEDADNACGFIWLEMSGQGCRSFETYGTGSYDQIFNLVRKHPDMCHITRLDIAFDDRTGVFDINEICDSVRHEHFISRLSKYQSIYSNGGNAVYFGSKKSNIFIRIYDKAAERGYDNVKLHWVRCEIQLKDTNAKGFVDHLANRELDELYLGVLKNYLSFRVPTNDSNKRRWPEPEWWSCFVADAVRTSVFSKPGVEYNLSACERYVLTQPIGSIKTLIKIYGNDAFIEMIKNAPTPKNPKYKQLISQAFAETKLLSNNATTNAFVELTSDCEMEFMRELKDGYEEVHNNVLQKEKERVRQSWRSKLPSKFLSD